MSGTMIKNPRANMPISGRGSGTLSGAAQGAAAGAMVAGPAGAVVGGILGAAAGFLGGSEQDKAAKHATPASKYARLRQERNAAIVRRNILKDFRMQRAASMLMVGNEQGGTRSSAPQGAVASLGAQFGFILNFFDADVYLQNQFQKHSTKAGKHAAAANMINSSATAIAGAASTMGSGGYFSPGATRGYSGLGTQTMQSTNTLSTPMQQNFSWIQAPKYNI